MNYEKAEITQKEDENPAINIPVIYMTQIEFSVLTKMMSKSTLCFTLEEMQNLLTKLMIGLRVKQQSLLSSQVEEEFQRHLPGASSPFVCR